METLIWILAATTAMSLISLVGLITLALNAERFATLIQFLVSFSAGSLIGGAFFHLIPETIEITGARLPIFLWLLGGFAVLFLAEILFNWHHCHFAANCEMNHPEKLPVTYLILLADGIHNFVDGLAIAGSFLVSVPVGIITALVAAAHEVPQELGDFGVLVYGGWERKRALFWNFICALSIIPGGLITYFAARDIDTTFLLPFAAGNFIYIAASDLIPEVKVGRSIMRGLIHFATFLLGAGIIYGIKVIS